MEGLPVVSSLIQSSDYMRKLDLKDAYFLLPVHPNHRKFLRFDFEGNIFEFQCLPFALTSNSQGLQTSHYSSHSHHKESRNPCDNLPGPYAIPARESQNSTLNFQEFQEPFRGLKISHKPEELFSATVPETNLPGNYIEFSDRVACVTGVLFGETGDGGERNAGQNLI